LIELGLFNPLLAVLFWGFRFCTSRAPAHTNLLELGQVLHNTIALACKRAVIKSQPMSLARWGVSTCKAK
jgi:hypothetical protein